LDVEKVNAPGGAVWRPSDC